MNYPDFIDATRDQSRALFKTIPDTMKGFGALFESGQGKPGHRGERKRIRGRLAFAVAVGCEPCIALSCRSADEKPGATREELGDVFAMCIQMGRVAQP